MEIAAENLPKMKIAADNLPKSLFWVSKAKAGPAEKIRQIIYVLYICFIILEEPTLDTRLCMIPRGYAASF